MSPADWKIIALTDAIHKAAKLSIPQRKYTKNRLLKPPPYWNEDCNKAVRDRNKDRNAMQKIELWKIASDIGITKALLNM